MTKKYLEYFPETFDESVPGKQEMSEFPYVAYSKGENLVVYTYVPKKMYYTSTDLNIVPTGAYLGTNRKVIDNTYTNKGTFYTNGPLSDISNSALANKPTLYSIKLTEGILTIGNSAFYNCSNLTTVQFPSTLLRLGSSSFQDCRALTEVRLPPQLQVIEANAFLRGYALKTIDFPSSLKVIGNQAFYESGLTEVVLPDTITGYTGTNAVGQSAFQSCQSLTKAGVGSLDGSIRVSTFYNCQKLEDVILGEGIMHIERGAFNQCYKLNNIVFPTSLQTIGEIAFGSCKSVDFNSIFIPINVNNIHGSAFSYCVELGRLSPDGSTGTIKVDAENGVYKDYDSNCIVHTSSKKLIVGCRATTIPSEVTIIGSFAFKGHSELLDINLHGGLVTIEQEAFFDCSKLSNLNRGKSGVSAASIPEGIQSIGASAFSRCTELGNNSDTQPLIIPSTTHHLQGNPFTYTPKIKRIQVAPGNYNYEDRSCNAVFTINSDDLIIGCQSSIIPSNCKQIGDYAFCGCSSLTGINNDGVTITIPESVTTSDGYHGIGTSAFAYSGVTVMKIPSSVEDIKAGTFQGCSHLSKITLHDDITSIGSNAFDRCGSLQQILIDGQQENRLPANCLSIGSYSFYTCPITSIVLNDNLTTIGDRAFQSCSKLESIRIPESVVTLGGLAFYGCYALREAIIGNGVKTLNNTTFAHCKALTDVGLPSNLETIGSEVFYSCTALQEIDIPQSVKSIGNSAFYGCTSLTRVAIQANSLLKSIESSAFAGCNLLQFIEIPESVQTINESAFDGCNLSAADFSKHEQLKTIGRYAFRNNKNLSSVTLPSSIENIGDQAFNTGSSIQTVCIYSEKAPTIGSGAFVNGSNIYVTNEAYPTYFTEIDGVLQVLDAWQDYSIVRMEEA